MDADELNDCLLNEKTRNVEQLKIRDVVKAEELLNIFMGTSVEERKEYILKHSEEAVS